MAASATPIRAHVGAEAASSREGGPEGIPVLSSIIEVVSDPQWRSEEVDAIILALRPVARAESS